MKKYIRTALNVDAARYEPEKNMEDGFELWTSVVTNGWVTNDGVVQLEQDDGKLVCPFIVNKRGRLFIRNGDYIIIEADGEKHVCSEEKFHLRFYPYSNESY